MNRLENTNSLRNAGRRGWGRPLSHVARWASVVALALLLWTSTAPEARAQSYPQTNCPAGQIPAFSGGGCVSTTQNASINGYGLPYQGSYPPESGKNGAPAIQRCNGTPTPFGQPCPGRCFRPQPQQGNTPEQPRAPTIRTGSALRSRPRPAVSPSRHQFRTRRLQTHPRRQPAR